jgi:hypothetical protein
MAPDNSYGVWVFDGSHRDLTLFDAGGTNRRIINVSGLPGMDNHEVNHPRWTNHPRFMTMTGPYRLGDEGHQAPAGGKAVEVYLGRFDRQFTRIEESMRLTHNKRADYFPDVWIEAGQNVILNADPAASTLDTTSSVARMADSIGWPGTTDGTVFLWENRSAANQITGSDGTFIRSCRVEPRGRAWYGRFFDMFLQGGTFVAQDIAQALLDACQLTRQLSIEALVTPEDLRQRGPARIVSFCSNGDDANFSLAQDGDRLFFTTRTVGAPQGNNPALDICRLPNSQPHHILVSYWPGHLVCYLDGEPIFRTEDITADMNGWSEQTLAFGNIPQGGMPWMGRLEGVAILNRFVDAAEAQFRARTYRERLATRVEIERLIVNAELVELCPVPEPRSIAPYRRALVVQQYEVKTVLSGKYDHDRMQVAHWAILDGEPIHGLPEKAGTCYHLVVERFDDHPELEPERLVMDTQEFDTPLFYDVGSYRRHSQGSETSANESPTNR